MNKKQYQVAAHHLAQYRRLLSAVLAAQGVGHTGKNLKLSDELLELSERLLEKAKVIQQQEIAAQQMFVPYHP